jgi:UDP-N-acetylglucosamine--N-acetylmuramyl-(pentapeptide) pyrophosphoryl-undecaprenol N-acetylglucosamine transferase
VRKVLIAVSGTGGHVYPGIALAEELRSRHADLGVLFATARGKPASAWIRRSGFEVREVRLAGFARRPGLSWLTFPFVLVAGCFGALGLLLSEGPDLVVGTGGYVSGPFVAFAAALGIPTVVLEQNARPGVATRLGSLVARQVHLAEGAAREGLPRRSRAVVSGNPVRSAVETGDGAAFRAAHGIEPAVPLVVVIGGSQGAQALTEAAVGAARDLGEGAGVALLVQAGERGVEQAKELAVGAPPGLRVVAFLDDMGGAYAAAQLVVARAGAMTLAELSAAGVPAVLVPYPYAAADHQTDNARRHAERGAALVLPQTELTGARLAELIRDLTGDPDRLAAMGASARRGESAGARERIADACEEWLG